MIQKLLILILCLFSIHLNAQTSVQKIDNQWTLIVDGKPFEVKGATFGHEEDTARYPEIFSDLQFLGVNTIRTWAATDNTQKLLDAAQAHGIKVMVGIWMRHGRPGMEDDDSFNYLEDQEGMEVMYEQAIEIVEKYKDHPAVLMWGIGNEVYLNMATDPEKQAYSLLLEKISSQIKKLDPDHPIASVEAWTFGLDWWTQYVPSIDIYGINSYGPGANLIQSEFEKRGIDKPYVFTEFGVIGEWDLNEDDNGVKNDPPDLQKYDAISVGYPNWISNKSNGLGVYIFHYANGTDHLSSWLFTHFDGMYRPPYWAIREAYTGQKPVNEIPIIQKFELTGSEVQSKQWVPVVLEVVDVENEPLEISFSYNQRTGSRKRRDQINSLNHRGNLRDGFEIQLPEEDGAIKVYILVKDTYNNLGIATTSITVKDEKASKRKYLVPKVSLPFYVYKDGIETPYIASGYMGNYEEMEVDTRNKEHVHSGEASLKIKYNTTGNWYGLGLVDPANDWGEILGGYDLSGATKFSFWARSNFNGITATIGFGMIEKEKPFPDTGKKSIEVKLTTEWKKYTIKLKDVDLSCIRSGLVIFSSSKGFRQDIYIDDVVFE